MNWLTEYKTTKGRRYLVIAFLIGLALFAAVKLGEGISKPPAPQIAWVRIAPPVDPQVTFHLGRIDAHLDAMTDRLEHIDFIAAIPNNPNPTTIYQAVPTSSSLPNDVLTAVIDELWDTSLGEQVKITPTTPTLRPNHPGVLYLD